MRETKLLQTFEMEQHKLINSTCAGGDKILLLSEREQYLADLEKSLESEKATIDRSRKRLQASQLLLNQAMAKLEAQLEEFELCQENFRREQLEFYAMTKRQDSAVNPVPRCPDSSSTLMEVVEVISLAAS